jgi:hypothetical protein
MSLSFFFFKKPREPRPSVSLVAIVTISNDVITRTHSTSVNMGERGTPSSPGRPSDIEEEEERVF